MKTLILFSTLLSVAPAFADASLDGKAFNIESGEKGKTTGEKEVLDFKAGKLHSAACDQYGFAPGAYTVKNGVLEADTASAKEGKIHWKAKLAGDAIDGSYVWSKAGQKEIEYWFKGTLKK